ncbi:hypothetical protein Clacol_007543 [Clathrus columnatus]|uniref:Uncharacterized protein n=1 Tax=Clathrus columnatus TaxID=1419009 RepID=A0AAV5AF68_9AGAM|nr:hypothetical protein Clacol_007543 [Clathrus columnatus]
MILFSNFAQPGGSLSSELIPKPSSSALEGGAIHFKLQTISGRALRFPFNALLRLFSGPTIHHALPLASDLSISVHSSSSPDIETSTGVAFGEEPITTRSEFSFRNLRRLRRQGWLVFPRELISLGQQSFLSPTLTSSATVLGDIGNTHRDTVSDGVQYIFSPQIIEGSAGSVYCEPSDISVLYPLLPHPNSFIPLLALTSATAENNPELEYVDYNSVVHIGSPLGPSFLNFALPGVLEEGSACEANNAHGGESETGRLGDKNSDSLSEFLDQFPPPPPVDSVINSSCDALTGIIEKEHLALRSPVHTEINMAMEQEGEQTAEHETIDYSQESVEHQLGYHNERIKSSQSENIIRTFPFRDSVHPSLSMPFGMKPNECKARGLGFLTYNYVEPVKG